MFVANSHFSLKFPLYVMLTLNAGSLGYSQAAVNQRLLQRRLLIECQEESAC